MISPNLVDVAKLAEIVVDHSTVIPGQVVAAHLVLPVPGDSSALGNAGFTVAVTWRVATGATAPTRDADGLLTNAPSLGSDGVDFIAPLGLQGPDVLLALMPPLPSVGVPTPGAPTATDNGPGNLSQGTYRYRVTFVAPNGETVGGAAAQVVLAAGRQVRLTAIPLGPVPVAERRIYRSAANGADGSERLITTLANNVTAQYDDNAADAAISNAALVPDTETASRPNPRAFWLIATITLRRVGDVAAARLAGTYQELVRVVDKVSTPISATGLSMGELDARLRGLLKFDSPLRPVEPGRPVPLRLLPKGSEDAEWDVDSATDIVPRIDIDASLKIDALFAPIDRILTKTLAVPTELFGLGLRLLQPITEAVGRLGTLFGTNMDGELNRILRRLRAPELSPLRDLELPLDSVVLNQNFTKQLVPRDRVAGLPGPRGLLPTVPSLAQQLSATDSLPAAVSVLPLVGSLSIPITIGAVRWELRRLNNDGTQTQLVAPQDYRHLAHTAGRRFARTFAIEPTTADSIVNVRVIVDYTFGTAAIAPRTVTLPELPIRLLGFDPLAFVASQLQLAASTDTLQAGEEVRVELLSTLANVSPTLTSLDFSFPLGELPSRSVAVTTAWLVRGQDGQQLTEGTHYYATGVTALARSISFAAFQILRRETPTPLLRYVSVRLTAQDPAITPQVLGPIGLAVSPLQLPTFAAFFRRGLTQDPASDSVTVVVPNCYFTQAPAWSGNWSSFRDRVDAVKRRLDTWLGLAAGQPGAEVVLLRNVLAYVASRGSGTVRPAEYLQSLFFPETYNYASRADLMPVIRDSRVVIVVNDARTSLELRHGITGSIATSVEILGTQDSPICLLRRDRDFSDWTFDWVPGGNWPFVSRVTLNPANLPRRDYEFYGVRFQLTQSPLAGWDETLIADIFSHGKPW